MHFRHKYNRQDALFWYNKTLDTNKRKHKMITSNETTLLTAIKGMESYNLSKVEYVRNATGFASEYQATVTLFNKGWDTEAAVFSLLYKGGK